MKETDAPSGNRLPALSADADRRPLTRADWAGRAFLALVVVVLGVLVTTLVPLLAVACTACEDGVRNPPYAEVLVVLAQWVAPATTLATVLGVFLPRRGLRVGCAGAGALGVLAVLIVVLGRLPG